MQLDVFNKQLDVKCKLDILSRLERHMYSTKQLDVFNKQLDVFNKQLDVFNKQLDVNM